MSFCLFDFAMWRRQKKPELMAAFQRKRTFANSCAEAGME